MLFFPFFHTCTEGSDESVRAKSRTINKFIAGTSIIRSSFLSHLILNVFAAESRYNNV